MPPKKEPEVIDLSSSPEPEPAPKPSITAARTKITEDRSSLRNNEYVARVKSVGDVFGVLERNRSFGNESAPSVKRDRGDAGAFKRIEKPIEKEREMTEAEKIRELRLKRFGGLDRSSGVGLSDSWNEQVEKVNGRVEKESVEPTQIQKMVNTHSGKMTRKKKESTNSASTLHKGEDSVMFDLVSDHDNWGGIDLTQDDDEDFGDFGSLQTKSKDDHGWKSAATNDMGMRHGIKAQKTGTTNFSDPFRSSSPVELPRISKNQSRKSATGSKTTIDVASVMKAGKKDINTKTTDFSDPFRSSSPFVVPRVAARSESRIEDEFSFMDDKFGTPVDFDNSYDMEVPVAKKRRTSPTPSITGSSVPRAMTKEPGGYRRTVSAGTQSSHNFKPKASGLKRSRTMDSDPIAFTSSPDVFDYKIKKAEKRKVRVDDDGFIDIDEIPKKAIPSVSTRPTIEGLAGRPKSRAKDFDTILSDDNASDESDASLPDISKVSSYKTTTKSRDTSRSAVPSPARTKPKSSKPALAAYEKQKASEKKAREKAEKAAEKVAAREAEKERKRVEKENKAIEKEKEAAIAKVNMTRTDKKVSRREMIVDFPRELDARLIEHTKVLLANVEVEHGEWNSPIANVIRWRRKVDGEWDDDEGCWMPLKPFIQKEKHVLVVIHGEEFVKLINAEEGKDLVCHVLKMKCKFEDDEKTNGGGGSGKNIIYLIEGLTAYLKKHRNAKNRRYTEAVRNQLEPEGEEAMGSRNKRKGKAKANEMQEIDEDAVEDALLNLQVVHGVLVHHTAALAETAEWITAFTQHLATARYRHAQDYLSQNFCMKAGQVKSGTNAEDTFIKMLQETNRLTNPIAQSVAGEYPSASKLIEAFEKAERKEAALKNENGRDFVVPEKNRAYALLKDLRKENRANGAISDRAVGPMLSKRLYKVFLGRDAGSTDI